MVDLANELLKLRFMAGPVESLYLNVDRVNERFVSHVGAISEWIRTAETEGGGGVDLKVVSAEATKSAGNQITYDVSQPFVRSLLLRESLTAQGWVTAAAAATEGQYVLCDGDACLRSPQLGNRFPPRLIRHRPWCPDDSDPLAQRLEDERAMEEAVLSALAGRKRKDQLWLLLLVSGDAVRAAAVLNSRWISDAVISYWHKPWVIFGTVRERVDGVPLIAAIHVWVRAR